jgi:transposase
MGVGRPYLLMLSEEALQWRYPLREVFEVFNALRWIAHTEAPWHLLPTNFPPWPAAYQQTHRWLAAGCFEALVHDLRLLLREGTELMAALFRVSLASLLGVRLIREIT